jgi:trimeric autotransporter adhesin
MRPPLVRMSVLALLVLISVSSASHSQTVDPSLWGTDGVVRAFARTGNALYVGGTFSQVLPPDPIGWARFDETSAAPTAPMPPTDGPVTAIEPDGSGGYFLGGSFTHIGGQPRSCLAHVLNNGTIGALSVNITNDFASRGVLALRLVANTLFVVGGFQVSTGSGLRIDAFSVNVLTGVIMPWNPSPYLALDDHGAPIGVEALNGRIFMGGSFAHVSGQSVSSFVEVDSTTGAVVAGMPTPDLPPSRMLRVGTKMYFAGWFAHFGGLARQGFAEVDLTTKTVTSWIANTNVVAGNDVNGWGLASDGASRIFVSGGFSSINGTARDRIAAVDATTGVLTSWIPPTIQIGAGRSEVHDIAFTSAGLYVAGMFDQVGALSRLDLARLNSSSGAADSTWNPATGTTARLVVLKASGGIVVTGGQAVSLGPLNYSVSNLAKFDVTTGAVDLAFASDLGDVYAVACGNGKVYAAGDGFVSQLNAATGAEENTFSADDIVRAMVVSGTDLYVGGDFTQVGAQNTPHLARCSFVLDEVSWNDAPNAPVRALAFDGATLYAGGDFTQVGTHAASHVAAFQGSAGSLNGVGGFSAPAVVRGLALDISGLYAVMDNGEGQGWNTYDGTPRNWNPVESGSLDAIAIDNSVDIAYLGGLFSPGNLDTWDLGEPPSQGYWSVSTDGEVLTLLIDGSDVYVGGAFGQIVTGQLPFATARRSEGARAHGRGVPLHSMGASTSLNLAHVRVPPSNPAAIGDPHAPLPRSLQFAPAFPNPSRSSATLAWSLPAASRTQLTLFDIAGRVVREPLRGTQLSAGPHQVGLDVQGLSAGIYFARLETRFGHLTRRLVVAH